MDKVVDTDNGCYNPKRDSEGKAIKTTDSNNTPKHVVTTIIRLKHKDGTEHLLSKGYLIGYDGFGEECRRYVSKPEQYDLTHFNYEKAFDPKKKAIVKNCVGPGLVETIYTLEFNEPNLKTLFDKRKRMILSLL